MWARAFRLLGIVVVSVFLGYLIGSNGMQLGGIARLSPTSGPFLVSNFSIQPTEVQPNQIVTISFSVTNTSQTLGIYSLVLKIDGVIDGVKEAELDPGSSQDFSFSITMEDPGIYDVFINGLSGSFTVMALAPAKPPTNWFVVGGIIAAEVVVGLLIIFWIRRRAT